MSFSLPGIGSKTSAKLEKLKIYNDLELLYHFPYRYLDFSKSIKIINAPLNQNVTINGQIQSINNIFLRSGKSLQKIVLTDSTGTIDLIWFNQPYLIKNFTKKKFGLSPGTLLFITAIKLFFLPSMGNIIQAKLSRSTLKPKV